MTTPHEHNSEGRTRHVLPRHQGLRETETENRAYFRPNRLGARALHASFQQRQYVRTTHSAVPNAYRYWLTATDLSPSR